MISDLIKNGFGEEENLNCSEKILYAANEVYKLGLDKEGLKLAAGFGGGMCIGSVCGALTGGIMVLSCLFVEKNARESDKIKPLVQELLYRYEREMGNINCSTLKDKYSTEEIKCKVIIEKASEILDDIIERELNGTRGY